MRAPRPHRRAVAAGPDRSAVLVSILNRCLKNQDPRSHADCLAEMRAKQAAGLLANPATAALLDRLERAIK